MNVRELAGAVKELQTRMNKVTGEAKDATERLSVLQAAIPEAIAMGDAALTQELRAERENLEAILRDNEASERVLSQKLEGAQRELAKARLPEVMREAEVSRDQVEEHVEGIRTAVQAFLDAQRIFRHTRNRAHEGDGRPTMDVRLRTGLAAAVVGLLHDSVEVR